MGNFVVRDGQTFLFIGDSITDCGRRGAQAPFGDGYVSLFVKLVTARYPERKIYFINKGIGGNKVTDLVERWRDDVLVHQPDWLSTKIGINDVHTYLRGDPGGISPEKFANTYEQIMTRTREQLPNCQIVLISPFYISSDRSGQTFRSTVLETLPKYIETVERMSKQYNTQLVGLHDIFQEQLKYRDADTFCPEPVHPNQAGHMVIANALLDALTAQ